MPETLPYSPKEAADSVDTKEMAQYLVRATIAAQQGKSLGEVITAIRTNKELAELDPATQATAAANLQSAAAGHEFSKVENLGQGVLGANRIGTQDTVVSSDVVAAAATDGKTTELTQVLEHENDGHGKQVEDTQDIVGADGEVITVWQQREGHAEYVSNPHARREGQPEDYREAQEQFENNDTSVLSAYATGRLSFVTAQAAMLRNSKLSYEEQERALQTANVQHQVAKRILFAIHGSRKDYELGPERHGKKAAGGTLSLAA